MEDWAQEHRLDVLQQKARLLAKDHQRLVDENKSLRQKIAELSGKNPSSLQQELHLLQQRVDGLQHALYGVSSEKRAQPPEAHGKTKCPQSGHGPTAQPHLPIVETEHELDEADKQCPECGEHLHEWQGQDEISEEIDVIPAKFVIVRHHRKKYKCPCGHIETALGPVKPIKSGRYSLGFATHVATQKYLDHLPLERQVRQMQRAGLDVTSQTLWDQVWAVGQWLEPTYLRLKEHLLQKHLIGMDETRWRMLHGKKDEKASWYVWAMCSDDGVFYHAANSRGGHIAENLLKDYKGRVMTDDYAVYKSLAKQKVTAFDHLNCWAHVRRKFVQAQAYEPKRAGNYVALIGELYKIERQASRAPPEDIKRLRLDKAKAIVDAIFYGIHHTHDVLPQSAFGKALSYARKMEKNLRKYIDDPQAPIDNNATERALRGVVLGRKNHLGSKSHRGALTTTILYSLLESAKLCDINPEAYLRHALQAAIEGRFIPLPHEYREQYSGH